jgi:4-diphosphocytidyl-2-C-methyl-D-erythritol kinase
VTGIAFAPAKLNLFLEIVARRPDGFHELETVMLPVDLYDTLEFCERPADGQGIVSSCNDPSLPTDANNLVVRAAGNWTRDVSIDLTKRIPSQAGMGGGSSDAATTLMAMAAAYGAIGLPAMANSLGSDVGFFLAGGPARCTGRGEIVEPVPIGGTFHFVVVQPPVGCPTAEVYKRVTVPSERRSAAETLAALAEGDPERLAAAIFNRLETPAIAVAAEVGRVIERMRKWKPLAVQVTGSGSAVFAVARDREHARRLAEDYGTATDDKLWVVRSITP